jgi:hypothetical protein
MTMVQPVCSMIFCTTIRVALSVMPPGVYGMIHLMGLFGQDWAWTNSGSAKQSASAPRRIQETVCFWL